MVKATEQSRGEIADMDPLKKTQKVKKNKKMQKKHNRAGVVYIRHIPHGFYEDEMKSFFSQFGKVLRVTVARSAKTGNSRGYGYVQFQDTEVAKIAAETMNNYLMFEKIVQCKVMPPELVTLATFANSTRRPGVNCAGQRAIVRSIEAINTAGQSGRLRRRAQQRRATTQRQTMARLAALGIKYDLQGGDVQEVPEPEQPASTPAITPEKAAVLQLGLDDQEISFKTPANTFVRVMAKDATPAAAKSPKSGKIATISAKVGSAAVSKSPKSAKTATTSAKVDTSVAEKTPVRTGMPSAKKVLSAKKSSVVGRTAAGSAKKQSSKVATPSPRRLRSTPAKKRTTPPSGKKLKK